MKKIIPIFIMIIVLLAAAPIAIADTSISVSQSTANPGDTITISGVTDAAQYITIRIVDDFGNIVYFGGAGADSDGNYSSVYTVASDMTAGTLYITAGSGSDIASAAVTIVVPEPTQERAINPQTGISDTGIPAYIWSIGCAVVLLAVMLALYILKGKRAVNN